MKILSERPGVEQRCHHCNSLFLIHETDVTCKVDYICGEVNSRAPDLSASWICPVCKTVSGDWLYKLPGEWREPIKSRMLPSEAVVWERGAREV